MDIGDIRLGDTIDAKFSTIKADGSLITLAGSPAIAAYPSNSTTEITAGITLTVDFDSRTGLHNVRVVATSGNGYATATDYALVLTAGTVDAISVNGYVVGHFSIEKRSALMPTTGGRTLDVSATGEGGIDWANVGSPTTTVGLSGTTIKTATDVETDTQDIQSRLPAALGANGNIKADIRDSLGVAVTNSDFTIASATATTVTLPTTYTNSGSLPDDDRYEWSALSVVSGTGAGQVVLLTTAAAGVRQYNVLSGTMPVQLDSTSACVVIGAWRANTTHVGGTLQTAGDIAARLPAALVSGRMDSSVGAMAANVVTASAIADGAIDAATFAAGAINAAAIADGAIDRATFAADTGLQTIRSGTAQVGSNASITLDAGASSVDDFYNQCRVLITGGLGAGQVRDIRDYNGTTKEAFISAPNWVTIPDNTSTFAILPSAWVLQQTTIAGGFSLSDLADAALGAGINVANIASGAKTNYRLSSTGVNDILRTALVESYRAAGSPGTLSEYLFEIAAHLGDFANSGTTKQLKKIDGTNAKAFTYDSSTMPTSITET